jgi:galactokinase
MLDEWVLPEDRLIYQRCRYVVEENARLQEAHHDLRKGDLTALGRKMFATHEGLSRLYEVSCPELDFLVEYVKNNPAVLGARMMGGGFGGCAINIVHESAIEQLVAQIKPAYELASNLSLDYYVASIEDGTQLMS